MPPQTAWRTYGDRIIALFNKDVPEELRSWERLRAWMALFPPPKDDRPLLWSFVPLGLLGGPETYLHTDAELVAALIKAACIAQTMIDNFATARMARRSTPSCRHGTSSAPAQPARIGGASRGIGRM